MENFDLVKAILNRASGNETEEEGQKLDAIISSGQVSNEKIQEANREVAALRAILPIIDEDTSAPFPEYARERLHTKVKETFTAPIKYKNTKFSFLKFLLPISAAAILIFTLLPTATSPGVYYHYATIDLIGTVRGEGEDNKDEESFFPEEVTKATFADFSDLDEWKQAKEVENSDIVNVIVVHDTVNGNLDVSFKIGSETFEKTFQIEANFRATLEEVEGFVNLQLNKTK